MRGYVFPAAVVSGSALAVAMLWLTDIPPGVSGEWTWDRIRADGAAFEVLLGMLQAGLFGLLLVLLAWAGARRVVLASRLEVALWLAGLSGGGFAWLLAAESAQVEPWNLARSPFVVYYPAMSGYFHKARYEVTDTREFLAGYDELMEEGDVLHLGTHPPGLFVAYRGLIRAADLLPKAAAWLEATAPEPVQAGFATIDTGLHLKGTMLTQADRAVIWAAVLITHCAAALVVWPLFGLLRLYVARDAAWHAVVFWPLLPAVAVFLPKSDALFTLPAVLLPWVWLLAVRRNSVMAGALAGAIGFAGLCFSLVFLPIGLIALLAGLIAPASGDQAPPCSLCDRLIRIWRPALAGTVTLAALTAAFTTALDLPLLKVWFLNWQNHAGFYAQYPRTWWKWLLVNPVELTLAVGIPAMALAVRSSVRSLRASSGSTARSAVLAVVSVWGLLWLSGKNSGEAARLWLPFYPLLLWISANGSRSDQTDESPDRREWLILLIIQAVVCLLTVTRIAGFHFPGNGAIP